MRLITDRLHITDYILAREVWRLSRVLNFFLFFLFPSFLFSRLFFVGLWLPSRACQNSYTPPFVSIIKSRLS